MAMTAEEVQSGRCACSKEAVLVTKFRSPEGTMEYNAFCKECLPDAKEYLDEKIMETAK